MNSISRALLVLIIVISTFATACAPSSQPATSTETPGLASPPDQPDISISSLEMTWPEPHPPEPCHEALPAPTLSLCIQNNGNGKVQTEMLVLSLPGDRVPGAEAAVLGTLPGGDWGAPVPLSLTGIPGFDQGAEGIIIINTNPAPDSAAEGIIIINTMPGDPEGAAGIIIVNSFPNPTTAEGIIIVNSKPGESSQVGATTLNFPEGIPGLNTPAADMGSSGPPAGNLQGVLWFEPLSDIQQMAEGIIWGGLISNKYPESAVDTGAESAVWTGIEWQPPPDDNKEAAVWTGIVWGDKPAEFIGADGIIIVNSLPGSDESTEGIIIVNSKDTSLVMGVIVEDKPGGDDGRAGIIIINTNPAPASGVEGIVWGGIVWRGTQSTEGASQSIIVQNMPGGAFTSQFGLPDGFGMPEGMMAMMGQGGQGPGSLAYASVPLQALGVPSALESGQEACVEITLDQFELLSPQLPPSSSAGSTDSLFDVFVEVTGSSESQGETPILTRKIARTAGPRADPRDIQCVEDDSCDQFDQEDMTLMTFNVRPESGLFVLYVKNPAPYPVVGPENAELEYFASLGDAASKCGFEGFDDRVYCYFYIPETYYNTKQPLELYSNLCIPPFYVNEEVSIFYKDPGDPTAPSDPSEPGEPGSCHEDLGQRACPAAGGEYKCVVTCTCVCP